MHRDLLGQAFAAMRHDLRKTTLTMAGMAWGIATVVLLLKSGSIGQFQFTFKEDTCPIKVSGAQF